MENNTHLDLLVEKYKAAKDAYYNTGNPIMSDLEFDTLEEQIKILAPNHTALAMVGYTPKAVLSQDEIKKERHLIPMGSLNKATSEKEFAKWQTSRGASRFHVSYKADGASIAIHYDDGILVKSLTRGDGEFGSDITRHAYLFKNVPQKITPKGSIIVRGEVVLKKEDWEELDPNFDSNPRNLVSGMLGRLTTEESNKASFLAFDVTTDGVTFGTESEKSEFLEKFGFVCPTYKGSLTSAEVDDFFKKTGDDRENIPYWIDGIVVKIEDIALQESMGVVDNKSKGQIARKFEPPKGRSTIIQVEWQVGQSGAITPVAIINPVDIGGTTVARASLSNPEKMESLGAFLGAEVIVAKAGDIIPQVVLVANQFDENKGHAKIEIPKVCPECGAPIEYRKNTDGSLKPMIYCSNEKCPAIQRGKILRFTSALDIKGLGEAVVSALLENKKIEDVSDLFSLNPETIEFVKTGETTLGRKRAESICSEITEKTSSLTLPQFLGAFGTTGLGKRRTEMMIEKKPELKDFEKWFDGSLQIDSFCAKAGVPKMGVVIFQDLKKNEEVIRKCLAFVSISAAEEKSHQDGMLFCITGKLPDGKKKSDYSPLVDKIGGKLTDELTQDVNYLVVADPSKGSSKQKKAEAWKKSGKSIKIIDVSEFESILDSKKPANNDSPMPKAQPVLPTAQISNERMEQGVLF